MTDFHHFENKRLKAVSKKHNIGLPDDDKTFLNRPQFKLQDLIQTAKQNFQGKNKSLQSPIRAVSSLHILV